jgi:ATP-dependent Clp protease ATP-binding subunit ClpC
MITVSKQTEAVMRLAKEAAREHGLGYVGTEHLLLGIVREGQGLGAQILLELGVTEYNAQAEVDRRVHARLNETWVLGRLPGTPHFRDVGARAEAEARGSANWQISSEHLLLALLAERDSVGHQVLQALGVSLESVRRSIARRRTVCRQSV